MYQYLKAILRSVIPKHFLFKNELFFRRFYALLYSGSNHQCNICNKNLKRFVSLNKNDLLCPACGSVSRHRRLWEFLNKKDALTGRILHFSPSRSLYRKLSELPSIIYYSSDFADEFISDYTFDITNINQKDNSFDTIIAYHILEHISDDKKAMTELFRILKPNGRVFIQTPFKSGGIYEDTTIKTPLERLKNFGQEDHVRIYSTSGLKKRLEAIGFKVDVTIFKYDEPDDYKGFLSPETILIASK